MQDFEKIGNHGISENLKGKVTLPVLQAGLPFAGAITQVLLGEIPRKSSLKETAGSYLEKSNLKLEVSPNCQKIIEEFQHGIILASHNNGNFSDFPGLLSLMSNKALDRLTIGAGKTVARMYQLLFPNIHVYGVEPYKTILSEVSTRDVVGSAKQISKRVNHGGVALLPFNANAGEMQGVHRQVIKGVEDDTPILEVSTEFSGIIGFKDVYKRILGNPPPMTVKISAELKDKIQLRNR